MGFKLFRRCRGDEEEEDDTIVCEPNVGSFGNRPAVASSSHEMTELDGKEDSKKPFKSDDSAIDDDDDDDNDSGLEDDKDDKLVHEPVVKRKKPRNPPFKVWARKRKTVLGEELPPVRMITFSSKKSPIICNTLRSITNSQRFFDRDPQIPLQSLLFYMDQLTQYAIHTPDLQTLVDWLEWEYEEEITKIKAMIAEGKITFEALWYLYKTGRSVVGIEGGELVGSRIERIEYNFTMFGAVFTIHGEVIKTDGTELCIVPMSFRIYSFDDLQLIENMEVRLMNREMKKVLCERGRRFQKIAVGAHYVQYTGNLQINGGIMGMRKLESTGRCMIDMSNYNKFNPDKREVVANQNVAYDSNGIPIKQNDAKMTTIAKNRLATTWPFVAGFSLKTKRWGLLAVNNISDIQFDTQAYDQLVLEANKKQLIRALVEHTGASFKDIITGKGGGCVFLLHGPPGTGKTLTAEAIADLLKRPLYAVTVGDLGTTPVELERQLGNILDLSACWNAVLLIDEADIFLERRTESDIQRNAMVAIFLRLLEYHQGVLFLTTNRVKAFDEAFHSRISVALRYEALDEAARTTVFHNLLQAAGVEGLNPAELARTSLNGRQIKNAIRLAQTLAIAQKRPVSLEHFERTINITQQFNQDSPMHINGESAC